MSPFNLLFVLSCLLGLAAAHFYDSTYRVSSYYDPYQTNDGYGGYGGYGDYGGGYGRRHYRYRRGGRFYRRYNRDRYHRRRHHDYDVPTLY